MHQRDDDLHCTKPSCLETCLLPIGDPGPLPESCPVDPSKLAAVANEASPRHEWPEIILPARNAKGAVMTIEGKLAALGLQLPEAPRPVANYVPTCLTGGLLFISGQISRTSDGRVLAGKLGAGVDVSQGREAAKVCALNILAQAKAALGSLERIERVVKLTGFVNSTATFVDQPQVVNGASDLLVDVLGYFTAAPPDGSVTAATPARLIDTRPSNPIAPASVRSVATGMGGAAAVIVNVTAVDPTEAGYLTVYAGDGVRSTTSNVNFQAGRAAPNLVIVHPDANGVIQIFNSAGSTHLVVDIVGRFD